MINKTMIKNKSLLRKKFGKSDDSVIKIPCLTTIQTNSYEEFLQKDVLPENRLNTGMQEIFNKHFPVLTNNGSAIINFIRYHLDEPKYNWQECKVRGLNYAYPIKVTLELIINEDGVKENKVQDVYIGEIPAMTDQATFIINGVERVIVSQLHRAPGVFFDAITSPDFEVTYLSRIIPNKGIWLDFEIDEKRHAFVVINKKKLNIINFLSILTTENPAKSCRQQIVEIFYESLKVIKSGECFEIILDSKSQKFDFDILGANRQTIAFDADIEILPDRVNHNEKYYIKSSALIGKFLFSDLYLDNQKIEDAGYCLDEKFLNHLADGVTLDIINPSNSNNFILNSLKISKVFSKEESILKLCSIIRPSDSVKIKNAEYIVMKTFFDQSDYNLSKVGRVKLNEQIKSQETSFALTKNDIIAVLKKLINVALGVEKPNHVDSLNLRRVRPVGELARNQFDQAILKLTRSMQDRMMSSNKGKSIIDFVNSRHFMPIMKDLWLRSSLSQQLAETNPLASLTHKRRISCYGAGGLQKDRVSTELRDLHATHYGRICVSETPEGMSVGLVMSCTVFAKMDEYGFICSPYKRVVNGKILNEIVFLTSSQEEEYVIAHYDNAIINDDNTLCEGLINCRKNHEHYFARREEIEYIDVSPKQILSLSASLIPCIEMDAAVRTVMGANMQRQALPLINPDAPLIGTGMEEIVVRDSNSCIFAKNSGKVIYVSSNKVIVRNNNSHGNIVDIYKLIKFHKSNDGTCINHAPSVSVNDDIEVGDIIAKGSAVDSNEIALGRNVRLAFLSYRGKNFEDAIVISSRLAQEFKSIGLAKFEISIMEHKQGCEEFTRELPNINEILIRNLDACGVINIGSHVKADEVLVGRITPKAETNVSPEERFLKVVFGGKSLDVKDTSLRVPPGTCGTVVDVKCFTRRGFEKNARTLEIEQTMISGYIEEKRICIENLSKAFRIIAEGILSKYATFSNEQIQSMSMKSLIELAPPNNEYSNLVQKYMQQKLHIEIDCDTKCKNVLEGDSLPSGVLQTIQVFIATEYVIQPGDKMAGRHGNKGIVSTVLPLEDMPFTQDGEPVDMVLTSVGISGRMNIGQIFETHLGKISVELGKKIAKMVSEYAENQDIVLNLREFLKSVYDSSDEIKKIDSLSDNEIIEYSSNLKNGVPFAVPVFEAPRKDKIEELFKLSECDISGKEILYDGITGEPFPQPVTVGVMYMMQLHHLVQKKEHARSTGPYSLVSGQPLGGRQQMGAQRLGEMEVWALQAYSASYTIHEMLTVKSDFATGRTKVFELISQGYEVFFHKGVPESFSVLVSELKALCFNVECLSFRDGELFPQDINSSDTFDAIRISPADQNTILSWSHGVVTKAETVNYRNLKPHHEGILSTRIFGPTKDNVCACGRHKGVRRKGIICSKCQTEVTSSKVRRTRMGHIDLVAPVVHFWYAKILPSRIAMILDISVFHLNKILAFELYCVVSQGLTRYSIGTLISEFEYQEALLADAEGGFEALTGAEGIERMLQIIDLPFEISKTRSAIEVIHNETIKDKLIKRLKILESFYRNNISPDAMIIRKLPLLPPELRPLVAIDGGRLASADSNEFYLKIIHRNNRLAKYISIKAPEVLIRSEKRMLQEIVDALFDNGRKTNPITTATKRPLKSLADNLKGKTGRFRQNLLGKRVDYSGRSVIIVGPELKFDQCGLPKGMALELFKPALLARLVLRGFAPTQKMAKVLIENKTQEVWDILYEITHRHVVLLNRAPTLHRLGIQAFYPVLIEGRAIKLHPLACRAFNADFDGDQMAVHALLSVEAQLEARFLMMSTKCILNPSNSSAIASPTKDMILGIYDMTNIDKGFGADNMCFSSFSELEHAVNDKIVSYSSPIKIVVNNSLIETTYGRLQLFSILPKHKELPLSLVNKVIVSKDIQQLIYDVFVIAGESACVEFLDKLMHYGFEYATLSGASFAYSDLPVPEQKPELIKTTKTMVEEYYRQYNDGLITEQDRHNKIIALWEVCAEKISKLLMNNMSIVEDGKKMNPIYEMAVSGARGSVSQLRQLAGLKGIMVKGIGEGISENAAEKALVEGVNTCEFVASASSARKDLSDIAVRTAQSGHLNRKLVDAAQDCLTKIYDCGTDDGIYLYSLSKSGILFSSLEDRIFGRTLAENITDLNGNILIPINTVIDNKLLASVKEYIKRYDIFRLKVRSPSTCKYPGASICCKCYGIDLSSLKMVDKHVAVGIIGAQSIGEPGTQLTMKNFHAGGVAQNIGSEEKIVSVSKGIISMNIKFVEINNKKIVISKNNILEIKNSRGLVISSHRIPNGARIYVENGDLIEEGFTIASWDLYSSPIIAEVAGTVKFKDLIAGRSYKEAVDEVTGLMKYIVRISSDKLSPSLLLNSNDGEVIEYKLQINDVIQVEHNAEVKPGSVLANRIHSEIKSHDIISGLATIVGLFEARKPVNTSILSEINGIISITKTALLTKVVVTADEYVKREYIVHKGLNLVVQTGDIVKSGDLLTDGTVYVKDILRIKGKNDAVRYFVDEVQKVYQSQGGAIISDKHIEIIFRQMLRSAIITDPGDTTFMTNDCELVDKLNDINILLKNMGKREVVYTQTMNGITHASVWEQKSFMAAASFQETTKVLVDASTRKAIDNIDDSIKLKIIVGDLIPSGIGGLMNEINEQEKEKKAEYIKSLELMEYIL